jgi:hypothetical protein
VLGLPHRSLSRAAARELLREITGAGARG